VADQQGTDPETRTVAIDRATPGSSDDLPRLAALIHQTREAVDKLTTYQIKMNHQERVYGTLNPPEDVLMSIRKSPKAVRLEWPTGPHKGREVIYVADSGKGLMHVHMGNSMVPLPDLTMPPDSPMALRSSRHPINEAGLETIVDRLESYLKSNESGLAGQAKVSYEGLEQPAGLAKACHKILRVNAQGELWLIYIDPDTHYPTMVQGTSPDGELIERHIYREIAVDLPALAKADAFDPVARWGEPKGFLQKLARATSTAAPPATKTQ
jgi:hypothetical protein